MEHGDGRRCLGSLVSLRTAVTSAWCARGPGTRAAPELWVRPAHAPRSARRIARVVFIAHEEVTYDAPDTLPTEDPWRGAAGDLAVLELETPFGEGARATPILMAMSATECTSPSSCLAVRSVPRPGSERASLRVVDLELGAGETCAEHGPRWSSLRPSALCLAGSTLCEVSIQAGEEVQYCSFSNVFYVTCRRMIGGRASCAEASFAAC